MHHLLKIFCAILIALAAVCPEVFAQENVAIPCEGKKIDKVAFSAPSYIRLGEIIEVSGIKEGQTLTQASLLAAINRIQERQIFSKVFPNIVCDRETIVTFELELAPVVGSIEFEGDDVLTDKVLRSATELWPGELYDQSKVVMGRKGIEQVLKRNGYFGAQVESRVEDYYVPFKKKITYIIQAGYESRLHQIIFLGDFPQDMLEWKEPFLKEASKVSASTDNIESLRNQLLQRFRKEGYLEARIEIDKVEYLPLSGDVDVSLRVFPGRAISFVFEGNNEFSSEELLEPLNLETRTVPFTENVAQSWCREIVDLYQQAGYFFAKAKLLRMPPDGKRAVFLLQVTEGKRYRLAQIAFEGVTAFSRSELIELLSVEESGSIVQRIWRSDYYVTNKLSDDMHQIEQAYYAKGYLDATVNYELSADEEHQTIVLQIRVNEGGQNTISQLQFVGFPVRPTADDVSDTVNIGKTYQEELAEQARNSFERLLAEQGYPTARVTESFDKNTRTLTYTAEPGPFVRIRSIKVAGNIYVKDYTILREVPLHSEDVWDQHRIDLAEHALYTLGIFNEVSIKPADGKLDSPQEDMVIRVKERDSFSLRLGLGYNSEDGAEVKAGIDEQDIDGEADSLNASFDGFFKTGDRVLDAGRVRTVYTNRHIFDSPWSQTVEGYGQFAVQLLNDYSYDRAGTVIGFQQELAQGIFYRLSANEFYENLYDVEPDIIIGPNDLGSSEYSIIDSQLKLDFRDDVFNPTSGTLSELDWLFSPELTDAGQGFWGFSSRFSYYRALKQGWVWVNNAAFELLDTYGDADVVPLSQRLFLGGRNSVRGYARNSIGPRGYDDHVVGGDRSLLLNSEIQISLDDKVVGIVFFDAGSVELANTGDFTGDGGSIADIKYSPGIGLQYKTPIGPLGISWGFPIGERRQRDVGRVNIGIGSTF